MADKIICIGECMKSRIVKKGIDEHKIDIVYNWADTSMLYPVLRDENPFIEKYNLKNYFTVMEQNLAHIQKALVCTPSLTPTP